MKLTKLNIQNFLGARAVEVDLTAWLDELAARGEIDTALIFGTLKSLPANLPQTMTAHWLENGVVAQPKELS